MVKALEMSLVRLPPVERAQLTALAIARPIIEQKEVRFSGSAKYTADGILYMDTGNEPRYFGPPSPEVDAAWMDLMGGK